MNLASIRKTENLHIVFWLIKDTCWVMNYTLPGVLMIAPTLGVALYLSWKCRHDVNELAHSLAVCFWIGANSVWMLGEFFWEDRLRTPAFLLFACGLICILLNYLVFRRPTMRKPEGSAPKSPR